MTRRIRQPRRGPGTGRDPGKDAAGGSGGRTEGTDGRDEGREGTERE